MLIAVSSLFLLHTAQSQELKPIYYQDGNQKLKGLITDNTGAHQPGVLILPAWMGIDEEAKTAALDLARKGFKVFIADIYGEGNTPSSFAEAAKISSSYKTNFLAYQTRIQLALEQLKKAGADASRLAVIGYCFGGTGALEAARAQLPVKGVVSIHGGLGKSPDRPNGALSASILIEHPADDESVSQEDIKNLMKEMNEAQADWQMIYYAHSKHTFTNPASQDYNPVMAHRAWLHTIMFLQEMLK